MYFQKRGETYSFVYYDPCLKKNIRLPSHKHPPIQSNLEAQTFCTWWESSHGSLRLKIKKREWWAKNHPEFLRLVALYELDRKEDAPNSWENSIALLKYYVLPFFLEVKCEPKIENWVLYYEEFRKHLGHLQPMNPKSPSHKLSYSTMNHVLNTLNTFIDTLYRSHVISDDRKCRLFHPSKLNRRSERSVLSLEVQRKIAEALKERNPLSEDFFIISLHTGMRLNELFGISMSDFSTHAPDSEMISRMIAPYDLTPYGYISLESQPSLKVALRDETGQVPRKPLKKKKEIDPEDCRLIPIFDKDAFNRVVKLWNAQLPSFKAGKFGEHPKDYLIFEGLLRNTFVRDLKEVQRKLGFSKIYTHHELRHTYSSWLTERTAGNYAITRMILGHSNVKMTLRYVHLNAKIQRDLQAKMQLQKPLLEAI